MIPVIVLQSSEDIEENNIWMALFTLQGKLHFDEDCSGQPAHMMLPFWKILHKLTPKEGAACGRRELPLPFAKQWRDSRSSPCTDLPRLCLNLGTVLLISTRERTRLDARMRACEHSLIDAA